jgi:hypothetical protein
MENFDPKRDAKRTHIQKAKAKRDERRGRGGRGRGERGGGGRGRGGGGKEEQQPRKPEESIKENEREREEKERQEEEKRDDEAEGEEEREGEGEGEGEREGRSSKYQKRRLGSNTFRYEEKGESEEEREGEEPAFADILASLEDISFSSSFSSSHSNVSTLSPVPLKSLSLKDLALSLVSLPIDEILDIRMIELRDIFAKKSDFENFSSATASPSPSLSSCPPTPIPSSSPSSSSSLPSSSSSSSSSSSLMMSLPQKEEDLEALLSDLLSNPSPSQMISEPASLKAQSIQPPQKSQPNSASISIAPMKKSPMKPSVSSYEPSSPAKSKGTPANELDDWIDSLL